MWGEPALGDVREAQAITGALLWISTRSRPDVAFAASKMGQWATKVPKVTIGLGLQVLAYLHSTMDLGLEFLHDLGAYFSNHGNLNLPRTSIRRLRSTLMLLIHREVNVLPNVWLSYGEDLRLCGKAAANPLLP